MKEKVQVFGRFLSGMVMPNIGAVLAVAAMFGVTPLVNVLNQAMSVGVGFFVDHGLLPLTSIFIEPARVAFAV